MADVVVEPGDVVLAAAGAGLVHAVVTGVRLGRVQLQPCDPARRPTSCSLAAVAQVFKPAGRPAGADGGGPLRPDPQLRLRL